MVRLGSRIIVIGNSGSGKTALASAMGQRLGFPVYKRGHADALCCAANVSGQTEWIVEGVFRWLAEAFAPRATGLVWLNLPVEVCLAGLIARGPQRGESRDEFADLLNWAEAYEQRRSGSSLVGHRNLYASYGGAKIEVRERHAATKLISGN
jgi:hypothetical protein